jgi:phosphatidylinositol alpha-1,6-mannosyltransferase
VLTVARMQDLHKGHDVMLRAMPLVRNAVPDARWVVLGDGPLRGTYEADARRLGVDDAVSFLGAVGDGERDGWFRRADVFAMPTRLPADGLGGEGFGIAYLEAAAYGLPVVAANAGGALDAVDAGRTGLLVAPDDHRQVAGALISLLGDLEYARAMGARAVEWAATFPWQRTADRVAAVLRAAAGGEARR